MEKLKGPDPARRDLVYRWLNGYIGELKEGLTTEQMQIAFLTEQIYQYRVNVCNRAHLDFEDKDMEAIINTFERLNRLCAELMYNHGWIDGALTVQE